MRRRRAPTTQLARAGERTRILISDRPLPRVRFRATCLDGQPAGRIDVETVDGMRTAELAPENHIDTAGLIAMSVVPSTDTAITFVPIDRPANPAFVALGAVLLLGGIAWTAYDFLGF